MPIPQRLRVLRLGELSADERRLVAGHRGRELVKLRRREAELDQGFHLVPPDRYVAHAREVAKTMMERYEIEGQRIALQSANPLKEKIATFIGGRIRDVKRGDYTDGSGRVAFTGRFKGIRDRGAIVSVETVPGSSEFRIVVTHADSTFRRELLLPGQGYSHRVAFEADAPLPGTRLSREQVRANASVERVKDAVIRYFGLKP
jgi:hypothetical protein